MEKIVETFKNAKMVVITMTFVVASMTGAYTVVSKYFVTAAHVDELIKNVELKLNELQKQTSDNRKTLLEMQLIRMESKISRGEKLTITEERVYNKLKKEYEANND